jgi:hypothetical protein
MFALQQPLEVRKSPTRKWEALSLPESAIPLHLMGVAFHF